MKKNYKFQTLFIFYRIKRYPQIKKTTLRYFEVHWATFGYFQDFWKLLATFVYYFVLSGTLILQAKDCYRFLQVKQVATSYHHLSGVFLQRIPCHILIVWFLQKIPCHILIIWNRSIPSKNTLSHPDNFILEYSFEEYLVKSG